MLPQDVVLRQSAFSTDTSGFLHRVEGNIEQGSCHRTLFGGLYLLRNLLIRYLRGRLGPSSWITVWLRNI